MIEKSNVKSSLIPFKLVRYSPAYESQILITKRKLTTLHIPHSQTCLQNFQIKRSNNVSPESKNAPSPSHTIILPQNEKNSPLTPLRSPGPSLKIQTNLGLLKTLSWRSKPLLPSLKSPMNTSKTNISERDEISSPLLKSPKWLLPAINPVVSSLFTQKESDVAESPVSSRSGEKADLDESMFQKRKKTQDSTYVYWSIRETLGPKPNSREGSQLVILNNRAYLVAGLSRVKHNDVRELDIMTWTWNFINAQYPPQGRVGHSLVTYKKKLVMFGGSTKHSENLGIRRCTSKVYFFSLGEQKWQQYPGTGDIPNSRRNHASSSLGKFMVVYGGMDPDGHLLNDLSLFDMKTKQWYLPDVTVQGDPGFRSHATLTEVFDDEIKNNYSYNIFSIPTLTKQTSRIANSGFYLFGGLNDDGRPCNKLHGLFIRNGKLIWTEISGGGKPPIPRYCHTACAIKQKIYIYGGRNDDLFQSNGDSCLADLNVFNVDLLLWENVQIEGQIPDGRWGHCMTAFGSQILILGGLSHKNFMTADLSIIETNREIAEEWHKLDKKGVKKPINIGDEIEKVVDSFIKLREL